MTTLLEIDGRPAMHSDCGTQGMIVGQTDEYRCPRCESLIPSVAMRRVAPAEGLGRAAGRGFGLQVYCQHCNAGFGIDAGYQDGRVVQYGPASLLMGESIRELKQHVGEMAGDISTTPDDDGQQKRLLVDLAELRRRHVEMLEAAMEIIQKLGAEQFLDRVAEVREQIAAGTYETEDRLDQTADAILDEPGRSRVRKTQPTETPDAPTTEGT